LLWRGGWCDESRTGLTIMKIKNSSLPNNWFIVIAGSVTELYLSF